MANVEDTTKYNLLLKYVEVFQMAINGNNPKRNTNEIYETMCKEISKEFADTVVSICIP